MITEVVDPNLVGAPKFWWCLWFNGVESLREFVRTVHEVWMVKLTCNNPGFSFQVRDGGRQFLVTFCNSARGGVKVEEGWGDFDGQIDWNC